MFPTLICILASTSGDTLIRVLGLTHGSYHTVVSTLDDQLKKINRVEGGGNLIPARQHSQHYRLMDGSLAVFGFGNDSANNSAAIQWLHADLRHEATLVFQPLWSSPSVVDAVPTGQPGEFAAIRDVIPSYGYHRGKIDETRDGIILTFVQFH